MPIEEEKRSSFRRTGGQWGDAVVAARDTIMAGAAVPRPSALRFRRAMIWHSAPA
jgi:hypothetical protein